jgi:hypothetical protein
LAPLLDHIADRRSKLAGRNLVMPRGLEDRLAKLEAELRAKAAGPESAWIASAWFASSYF